MIDREVLQKIAEENVENTISKVLSKKGYNPDVIGSVFRFASKLYKEIPPELINWKFRIILLNDGAAGIEGDIMNICQVKNVFAGQSSLIILDEYRFIISDYECDFDSKICLSYNYYSPQNECFYVDDTKISINRYVDTSSCSIFMIPTYKELDEAIYNYNIATAKHSMCSDLERIWVDNERLEFCNKPEHWMRDSLWRFLKTTLRGHSVKREQNVDETHPVDIKVTWPISNILALIEVKWLGKSGNTSYGEARANEGAKQLIEYIDASYKEEPDKHFIGYLAVFDGRRRGTTKDYYREREINYKSEYHTHASMKYMRLYLEPKVS